ncbi:MAG: site-2 protease family protein [Candidatus Thermoplasmatota archaeon]|nr:site-2 protease family protein [Candidatus Thermoplasmatota archaeon]
MGYIVVILTIGALVLIHELGHLLAGLWQGVPIQSFSLGFGPKLISRIWRGVEYRLSMIPLGGYVLPRVRGIEDLYAIPVRKRVLFSLGGPAANFIAAYLMLFFINIYQNGPGADLLAAPLVRMFSMTVGVFSSYGMLFREPAAVSGVVGIVTQGGSFVGGSLLKAAIFAVFLSLNLGIFNLLPIPALDGGKVLFAMLEKLSLRTRRIQLPVTVASVIFLVLLMGSATLADIVRVFTDVAILS